MMTLKRIVSLLVIAKYKIRYNKKFQCKWSVIIDNSLIIRINGNGTLIIGNNVEIRHGVILNVSNDGSLEIGDEVFINDYCCLNSQERITIEKGVQLGQGIRIYDHDHDYKREDFKYYFKRSEVTIGEKAWIGSNTVILMGSVIGKRSIIGAGTVVKGIIQPYNVLYTKCPISYKKIGKKEEE